MIVYRLTEYPFGVVTLDDTALVPSRRFRYAPPEGMGKAEARAMCRLLIERAVPPPLAYVINADHGRLLGLMAYVAGVVERNTDREDDDPDTVY